MSDTAYLPLSAPFSNAERNLLDTALRAATPIQRAWLSGFLAGIDRAAPSRTPLATTRLTILYASESGNSEGLAQRAAKLARKQGFGPKIIDFADLDLAILQASENLLVIAATWGEGEPPSRAVAGFTRLMGDGAPRLDGVKFGVLALGDTAYAGFCTIGRRLDERLSQLGASRIIARVDCDLDFAEPAAAWTADALARLAPKLAANAVAREAAIDDDTPPQDRLAEIAEHINLNSSRSDKQTIHLALGFDDGAPAYEPGDSLEIHPENDAVRVDEVLAATGLSNDDTLRHALTHERDITTLSAITAERFAAATGNAAIKKLIETGEIRAWVEGRQMIDLLEAFPARIAAEQLTALTRKLPPRAYSIASSRREVADEAHLLVAAVRYASHGRARAGVASTHVADRLRAGAKLRVRLKKNPYFRLPADGAADIIMIGPGTGIAPFRAFLQDRRAAGATGRSWLFFGDRHFTHDFLYQTEWQEALDDHSLTRLDVAFSRDQPEKIYVQDRLFTQRRDLIAWLDGGARLYVCGDAKAMAKDVRKAVLRAFEDVKDLTPEAAASEVARLERDRRYLQDVY